jgi:phosphoglycerol transferase MdoB-like AlkP superfamily enzyme
MKRPYQLNEYLVLVARFLFLMLLYTLCRIGFYIFNFDSFPNIGLQSFDAILLGGLKFDLSGLLYVNALYIFLFLLPLTFMFRNWYQGVLKWLFILTNGLGLAMNVSDFIYYRFTLKRTTSSVFDIFGNEENLGALWSRFIIDYWQATLFWVALMVLLVWFYGRLKPKPIKFSSGWYYGFVGLLFLTVFSGFTVVGMRGGWRHSTRPINISNAGRYVSSPEEVAVVLNTPFSIIRTLGKKVFNPVHYFEDPAELHSLYSPVHNESEGAIPNDSISERNKPNVVIIILESFGREHIGALNQTLDGGTYKGYTPFLDSLISESLVFEGGYANGRKSIDAMPSIIASIPALVQPYVVSEYASNKINSMASLLSGIGYETVFYHGAPNGSMGFLSFSKMAGYAHYVGKTEYNNDDDFDGIWGIWDEPFFQFFAQQMTQLREPFLTTIFSISSHHPFEVPEKYKGVFPKGPLPLHECMGYTDMALRKFFETASQKDWFQNTLFVITADHCTIPFHEAYKTNVANFAIPIIFYKPGGELKHRDTGLAQQIDIMPTVLSYVGFDKPYIAFGNDLLNTKPEDRFVINYFNESYQFLYHHWVLYFNEKVITGIYNLKEDPLQHDNLLGKLGVKEAEDLMKAFIQQYNNRMIEDRLVVDN